MFVQNVFRNRENIYKAVKTQSFLNEKETRSGFKDEVSEVLRKKYMELKVIGYAKN